MAVSVASMNLGEYEMNSVGINFHNINDVYNNYKFSSSLIMMAISFGVLTLLGLYLDNVLPSTYGVRKPIYFCLTPRYWRGPGAHIYKRA